MKFVGGNDIKTPLYIRNDNYLDNNYLIYKSITTSTEQRAELNVVESLQYIKDNQVGHEGLFGAVKPYFDFDFPYKTKTLQSKNEHDDILQCQKSVCEFLGCEATQLTTFTSNGKKLGKTAGGKTKIDWINSIHIIVNNKKVYQCGSDLKTEMNTFAWVKDKEPDF